MIVEVSSKVPFWFPHDSRGVLEVSTRGDPETRGKGSPFLHRLTNRAGN